MKRAGEVEIIGETKRSKSESKNFFHLSRVRSLGTSSNANKGPSLSSLIDDSNINFMVQFNFLIDIEWFTSLISLPQRKTVPILIIHGETNEGKIRIEVFNIPSRYS